VDGTEFDLVLKFREAKLKKDAAEKAAEEANMEFDKTENDLIDLLTAKNATKTATYDGVGSVTLVKPRVYASVLKENQDKLFAFLRGDAGRADLIKEVVNSQSLSGFVKEELESGKGVPEFINYFLKSSARFNAPKES
jgi:hypothetical protein